VTNTWTRLAPDPLAGSHLVSAWTGKALFSFNPGGQYGTIKPGDASSYDPTLHHWTRLPGALYGCSATQSPAWTGHQLLLYCPREPTGSASAHDGLAFTPAAQ
jgi:hypothetical protein